uniref:Uncharacterized protein n=1 Tax=Megaselia scalaris TaxID=36166 RepID=T1GLI4_MEGSC
MTQGNWGLPTGNKWRKTGQSHPRGKHVFKIVYKILKIQNHPMILEGFKDFELFWMILEDFEGF